MRSLRSCPRGARRGRGWRGSPALLPPHAARPGSFQRPGAHPNAAPELSAGSAACPGGPAATHGLSPSGGDPAGARPPRHRQHRDVPRNRLHPRHDPHTPPRGSRLSEGDKSRDALPPFAPSPPGPVLCHVPPGPRLPCGAGRGQCPAEGVMGAARGAGGAGSSGGAAREDAPAPAPARRRDGPGRRAVTREPRPRPAPALTGDVVRGCGLPAAGPAARTAPGPPASHAPRGSDADLLVLLPGLSLHPNPLGAWQGPLDSAVRDVSGNPRMAKATEPPTLQGSARRPDGAGRSPSQRAPPPASRVAPPARGQRHPGPSLATAAEPPAAAGQRRRTARAVPRSPSRCCVRRHPSPLPPRGARSCPAPPRPVPSHGGGDAPPAALPADPSLLICFRREGRDARDDPVPSYLIPSFPLRTSQRGSDPTARDPPIAGKPSVGFQPGFSPAAARACENWEAALAPVCLAQDHPPDSPASRRQHRASAMRYVCRCGCERGCPEQGV
ncbi:basic proline-rich protein-like [Prinia subflava]|uniref:basic proline-rich protein-like n=1 Tax=Prinia subflava TaxID=208062 RepID=UPI002FE10D62